MQPRTFDKKDLEHLEQTNAKYELRQPVRKQISDIYEGTQSMRNAGTQYLPQFPLESGAKYYNRKNHTFLLNMVRKTAETLTGRVFKKDPVIEVPEKLKPYLDDIDLEGSSIEVFAQKTFNHAIRDAFTFIHTDFTRAPSAVDLGRAVTRKDEADAGIRPYWRSVRAGQVFNWKDEIIGGKNVLTEVRIREKTIKYDGMKCQEVDQIRLLMPGEFHIFQRDPKAGWTLVDSGGTPGMDKIPLDIIYTSKESYFDGAPILSDLSWKNIEHWQSSSDQRNILHVARVPILTASGATEEEMDGTKQISTDNIIMFTDPAASLNYVEHSGAAIQAGERDLDKIESQMHSYGLQILQNNKVTRTATEAGMENETQISLLGGAAKLAADGFQNALFTMLSWIVPGSTLDEIVFSLSSNVGVTIINPEKVKTVIELRKLQDITLETALRELKEAGALTDDLDIEAEAVLVKSDSMIEFKNEPEEVEEVDEIEPIIVEDSE